MQYYFASEIRNVVHELHQKIESTYLAFRMMHGIISRAEYSWILAQLYCLHQYLEPIWQSDSELSHLYDLNKYSRLPNIKSDLSIIVNGDLPVIDSATQNLCEQIAKMYQDNAFSLIGAMYVVEGSRLGSVYLSEPLMNSLKLEDTEGASFFLCTPDPWYKDWYKFKENINRIDDLARHIESINFAAIKTFEGLIDIYQTKPV